MKKVTSTILSLVIIFCFQSLVYADANAEYRLQEKSGAPGTFELYIRASNILPGETLEFPNGNLLAQFRLSVVIPAGSTTFGPTSSAFSSLHNLNSSVVNSGGTNYVLYFSNANQNIVIPDAGTEVLILEFTRTAGADNPVLWESGTDPVSVGGILVNNRYAALAPPNVPDLGNYSMNYSVVPVELTIFEAQKQNEVEARLIWETESELNTSHFSVERSGDGKNWLAIDRVNAVGFSTMIQTYSLIDRQASNATNTQGNVFYRLKIIDFDGSFEYSQVKTLNYSKVESRDQLVAYPNPARNFTTIAGLTSTADYAVYGKNGVVIKTGTFLSGENKLDITSFSAGVYYIEVKTESNLQRLPIVVLR